MIGRGDLGLQIDLEDVPLAQKRVIRACNELGKPVITATQMLESMIHAPRPTRAEVADIANAVLDGTDALMLSGETATGDFPIECVRTMAHIARKAEAAFDHDAHLRELGARHAGAGNPTEAVAHAVAQLADLLRPKAILTTTSSGQTPCLVSKYRPVAPVLCATWSERTCRQLALVWGVEAIHIPLPGTTDEIVSSASDGFASQKRLKSGDRVIVTAGVPAGVPGNTNLILVHNVKQ
jgi:pyruvate kinase